MSDQMLDLDNLRKQTMAGTKKVMADMAEMATKKPDIKVVIVLLGDIIILQALQGSLTLAFLERWADETAEPAEEES